MAREAANQPCLPRATIGLIFLTSHRVDELHLGDATGGLVTAMFRHLKLVGYLERGGTKDPTIRLMNHSLRPDDMVRQGCERLDQDMRVRVSRCDRGDSGRLERRLGSRGWVPCQLRSHGNSWRFESQGLKV